MNIQNLDQILEKYAGLIVKVGLNLQPGQRLFIWVDQLEIAPLVRQVVKKAYQGGSSLVSVLWNDEELTKIRFTHAPRDSFEEFASWQTDARINCIRQGDAHMRIGGGDPDLLKGQNPELIKTATKIYAQHAKPVYEEIGKNTVQWLMVCPPTKAWASLVFPKLSQEEAVNNLWEAVIQACRLNEPAPEVFWKEYLDVLEIRSKYLTRRSYKTITFKGRGTDLRVGLPEGHIWLGGWDKTPSGVKFIANIPTEEVFTLPHRDKVEGTVRATKPLSYEGNLIENFQLTFSKGKVIDFSAEKGEDTLRNLLETDPTARLLGEVALVPHGSPISQQNLVFLNTLYDENASNHLALGNAYRFNLERGTEMSESEFTQAGGNESLIHVDFMFGSGEMNVDGILPNGNAEPIMRAGEWAFDV